MKLDLQRERDLGSDILAVGWRGLCVYRVYHLSTLSTEFQRIAMATAVGFAIMGFIGFFVKLIHIPINNIIV